MKAKVNITIQGKCFKAGEVIDKKVSSMEKRFLMEKNYVEESEVKLPQETSEDTEAKKTSKRGKTQLEAEGK